MSRMHPREMELARASDGECGVGIVEHVRQCAHCRSVVADYRWLEDKLGVVLRAAAGAVPVPHSGWQAVQGHISVNQQRLVTSRRLSVAVSVMLAACIMLVVFPIPEMAVGAMQTLPPGAALAPWPVTSSISGERCSAAMTPTPALSGRADLAPPLWPPPTQPQPDVWRP